MNKRRAAEYLRRRQRLADPVVLVLAVAVLLSGCGSATDSGVVVETTASASAGSAASTDESSETGESDESDESGEPQPTTTETQLTSSEAESAATSAESEQETVTTTAPDDVSPGEAGTGQAIRISDTPDIADRPLDKGEVVIFAVPAQFELVPELDPEVNPGMGHASFALDDDRIQALGAAVATINSSGRFEIDVAVGEYLVCLANSHPAQTPGPPYQINGCAPVSVDESLTFNLTFGEGGVQSERA